jgi:hypothetical protein
MALAGGGGESWAAPGGLGGGGVKFQMAAEFNRGTESHGAAKRV